MNNNKQFENLIRNLRAIKMAEHQKDSIRNELLLFVDTYKPVQSPYAQVFLWARRGIAVALAVLMITGSVTKSASADALPGERLYTVKIMHENITAASKNTPEKKADFEIKRAEKRIQEATQLAQKQKLAVEEETAIIKSVKKHTTAAREKITEIQDTDKEKALELNKELKTTLKVNGDALKKVSKAQVAEQETKIQDTENQDHSDQEPENKIPSEETPEDTQEDKEGIINETENQDIDAELDIPVIETGASLLASIENEVTEVEIAEKIVEEEIIKKQEKIQSETTEETNDTTTPLPDTEKEDLENEIDLLNKVIQAQEDIIQLEEELGIINTSEETETNGGSKEVETEELPAEENTTADLPENTLETQEQVVTSEDTETLDTEEQSTPSNEPLISADTETSNKTLEESISLGAEAKQSGNEIPDPKLELDIPETDTNEDEVISSTNNETPEETSIAKPEAPKTDPTEVKIPEAVIDESVILASPVLEMKEQARTLIKEKKYGQALIILQNIKSYYLQERTTRELETLLGIDIDEDGETTNLDLETDVPADDAKDLSSKEESEMIVEKTSIEDVVALSEEE